MNPPDRFSVRYDPDPTGQTVVVELVGQLDWLASEEFGKEISANVGPDCRNIVFDMTRLKYIGSPGLQVLVDCVARLKAAGVVCAAGPNENVRSVLEVTKVVEIVRVYPTRADALDAVGSR